jgi:hypothetical protein
MKYWKIHKAMKRLDLAFARAVKGNFIYSRNQYVAPRISGAISQSILDLQDLIQSCIVGWLNERS